MIELLNKLASEGSLKQLVRAGFVDVSIIAYIDIYNDYLETKANQTCNACETQLKQDIADKYGISLDTVYRIIRLLK